MSKALQIEWISFEDLQKQHWHECVPIILYPNISTYKCTSYRCLHTGDDAHNNIHLCEFFGERSHMYNNHLVTWCFALIHLTHNILAPTLSRWQAKRKDVVLHGISGNQALCGYQPCQETRCQGDWKCVQKHRALMHFELWTVWIKILSNHASIAWYCIYLSHHIARIDHADAFYI